MRSRAQLRSISKYRNLKRNKDRSRWSNDYSIDWPIPEITRDLVVRSIVLVGWVINLRQIDLPLLTRRSSNSRWCRGHMIPNRSRLSVVPRVKQQDRAEQGQLGTSPSVGGLCQSCPEPWCLPPNLWLGLIPKYLISDVHPGMWVGWWFDLQKDPNFQPCQNRTLTRFRRLTSSDRVQVRIQQMGKIWVSELRLMIKGGHQ